MCVYTRFFTPDLYAASLFCASDSRRQRVNLFVKIEIYARFIRDGAVISAAQRAYTVLLYNVRYFYELLRGSDTHRR